MTPWDPSEDGRYWVVGGRYTDVACKLAIKCQAHGPFTTRYEAEACWRALSFAQSHDALARFTILEDTHVARAAA